jgi:hypothetical protein
VGNAAAGVAVPAWVEQMRTDAAAARMFAAAQGVAVSLIALLQGIARVLSGGLDSGDVHLQDSVAAGGKADGPHLAIALAQRSLVAMARGEWGRAEDLAQQAHDVVRRDGIEESTATPWSARCKPAQPCTGEMARWPASRRSVPSGCGPG